MEFQKLVILISFLAILIGIFAVDGSTGLHINIPSSTVPHIELQEWKSNKKSGDIRCFCNLPPCVAKGYMCKSQAGCFSDLLNYTDVFKARHGCLELFESDKQDLCQNQPNPLRNRHPKSLLLCCDKDMCNHVDSPEIRARLNETFPPGPVLNISTTVSQDKEVWLKAATIAVTVCGTVILLALILVALRILRSRDGFHAHTIHGFAESQKPNQNELFYHENHSSDIISSKKVPLLKQKKQSPPNFGVFNGSSVCHNPLTTSNKFTSQKNETNAKLNFSEQQVVPIHKLHNQCQFLVPINSTSNQYIKNIHKSNNNAYHNVNLTNSPVLQDCRTNKLYLKQDLASVILWNEAPYCGNSV